MRPLVLLLLSAAALSAASRIKLEGLFTSGLLTFTDEDTSGWFELTVQNIDGAKAAVLDIDAIGCSTPKLREAPDTSWPIRRQLARGELVRLTLDPGEESCALEGDFQRSALHSTKELLSRIRFDAVGILIRGDIKGIVAVLRLHKLDGNELTTVISKSHSGKLHGRGRIRPLQTTSISGLMNFGQTPAFANICQNAYMTMPPSSGSALVDLIAGAIGSRIECVDSLFHIPLPPRRLALTGFDGPQPMVWLEHPANDRVLGASSYILEQGQTSLYTVDSSIQFEEVK